MNPEIRNEVELKKQQREEQRIDKLKKAGKSKEEIEEALSKYKGKEKEKKEVIVCHTVQDEQKRKLDRLMSNPNKEVYIPQQRKEWKPRDPAEFVRHVMGSSAGAGSGEFHVYRNIRKRELKRQEYMEKKTMKEELDEEFQAKMETNKEKAEDSTNKKRAKRQRRKQKKAMAKKAKKSEDQQEKEQADSGEEKSDQESEEEEEEENNKEPEEPHFIIGGK